MSGLHLDGIHKSFGDVDVLHELDLDVPDGTLLTLLGPSGSGKTTLLRIAAGLERPDRGRIGMDDRDVTDVPPARRNVAMVFQGFALFPHMTVAENIGFGLAARKTPRAEIRRRVEEAALLAGCQHLLDRRPGELSGGEQQRAALARGLARRPGVFLLDEPLSNLDAPVRAGMRADLMRLQRRIEGTMLYVTHDQAEALTMGDLVAVLDRGTVQQVGPPEELYRRPSNRLVATFLGTPGMNVLPAVVDGGQLRLGPFRLPLPRGVQPGPRVEVGIRPAAVRIGDPARGEPATVELVEVAGEDAYVHLRAGEIRVVAAVPARARPQAGDQARVAFDPDDVYVFDADTGATLGYPA
ncbi:MAG TPA: ABC transporter ATP-binding protein [Actinomycetota bacterium]|nr:ABC transporter ATP-binding protein [Actinomycetota bacterium]